MLSSFLKMIFGSKSDRDIKKMRPLIEKINQIELEYQKLTDDGLRGKTDEFKKRIADGATVADIMCEGFAAVKNACRRLCGRTITVCDHELVWDMIPYDVQIMGAISLHLGNISEMQTGEGKTLVATMPLYLNALTGKNCQLVTVNDYLAKRDSEWMGAVYKFLGLTVGCLQNDMHSTERKEQYACDITYGTNSEFGFDYLRDMGMANSLERMVQRDHYYAIIDEVDSILIDEARTPLIISGPVAVSTHQFDKLKPSIDTLFLKQNMLCSRMVQEARDLLAKPELSKDDEDEAIMKLLQVRMGMPTHKQLMHILEDGAILKKVDKLDGFVRSDNNRGMLQDVQSELFFTIEEKTHEADLTEKGRNEISPDDPEAFVLPDLINCLQDIEKDESLDEQGKAKTKLEFQENFAKKSEILQNLSQLLKAYCLFEKDVHYVVQANKVLIVDEHTGRLMPGRRFSDGLHQALEAKENVEIERETQTLATITIQNYFRMYEKLAGMTGTAETEANEFHQIYKLDVIVIPTNRPCKRTDNNDCIYKTKREKFNAIVDEVEECYQKGQPVLLGTVSVEDSEILSRMLKRKKIPHNVLNAKNHESEAEIVARAGQKSAVTVATNMAGRGTDIKLGAGIASVGGLHVIGSARHDSRRIDRQLRGRCARQGDPGSSRFYVSLEDNLMRLFGSDRIVSIMERFGLEDGEELQHPWLNKSIETAQRRVEQHHFAIRKRTLEYDDVMNKQREVIYGLRKETLVTENPREIILDIVNDEITSRIAEASANKDEFNAKFLLDWLNQTFPIGFSSKDISPTDAAAPDTPTLHDRIMKKILKAYEEKEKVETTESLRWLEKTIILEAIDRLWQEHLHGMDHLRASIGLRAYAQKDPLIEYKHEAFKMFSELMQNVNQDIMTNMFRSATSLAAFEKLFSNMPTAMIHESLGQFGAPQEEIVDGAETNEIPASDIQITFKREIPRVGRNDQCPCGSGKKYKKCCGQ